MKTFKARVKKDGRLIEVYKLNDGRYNIYLGDNISISAIEAGRHKETFEETELDFL